MEPLRSNFEEVQRQTRIKLALDIVDIYFDRNAPKRLISGIALSSRNRNSKGIAFDARGVEFSLPAPLLIDHDWNQPVGRVTALEVWGDFILFKAEIGNRCMRECDDAWSNLILQTMTGASVKADGKERMSSDKTFVRWRLDEISLTCEPADSHARVTRCSERLPYIRLDGPSETVFWSTP